MSTPLVITICTLAVLAVGLVLWGRRRSARLNDYFCNAVKVYGFTGNEHAKIAAVVVATVARGRQREGMILYLRRVAADLTEQSGEDSSHRAFASQFAQKALELEREILTKGSRIAEIAAEKKKLGRANSEYLKALNKFDPSVFVRLYPHLFK